MTAAPGHPPRREVLRGACLVAGVAVATLAGARLATLRHRLPPYLLSEGLAVGRDGVVRVLPVGSRLDYVAGTRVPTAATDPLVMDRTERSALIDAALERRAGAAIPSEPWHDLAESALDDLLALTSLRLAQDDAATLVYPSGSVIAGPVSIWRYTWPRDAAFAAAALSAVGLRHEALQVLDRLAALMRADGSFQARYTADGGVPDDRSPQTDGTGWFLWAAGRILLSELAAVGATSSEPEGSTAAGPGPLGDLATSLGTAAARLLAVTGSAARLPEPSPDYWEVEETRLTLGTAAPVLLGLEAAARLADAGLLGVAGAEDGAIPFADALARRAREVRVAVEGAFAPHWGRHAGRDDVDAALCWVLPPFTEPLAGARQARTTLVTRLARGSGGLAPGSSWRDDGVSWTPETALVAWSAQALGLADEASQLRKWLTVSCTAVGALPEKVAATGAPAGPAPLVWTCALVILAACD